MKDTDYGDFNRSDGGTFLKQDGVIVAHLPPTAPATPVTAVAEPEAEPAAPAHEPVAQVTGEEPTRSNQPAPRRRRNRQE